MPHPDQKSESPDGENPGRPGQPSSRLLVEGMTTLVLAAFSMFVFHVVFNRQEDPQPLWFEMMFYSVGVWGIYRGARRIRLAFRDAVPQDDFRKSEH